MKKIKYLDSREKIILKYIRNKKVLDLGAGSIRCRFLHRFVAKYAREAVGLELDKKRAENLRKRGYKIVLADAQNFNLNRKFDVILAGDLIEHLTNFDGFFKSAYKHLKKDGCLIINTPNIHSINLLMRGLVNKIHLYEEHTCAFNAQLLKQLISFYPFKIAKMIYFNHKATGLKNKIIRMLSMFNKKYRENIIIICKRK